MLLRWNAFSGYENVFNVSSTSTSIRIEQKKRPTLDRNQDAGLIYFSNSGFIPELPIFC